jgi:ankyrin repeat protein
VAAVIAMTAFYLVRSGVTQWWDTMEPAVAQAGDRCGVGRTALMIAIDDGDVSRVTKLIAAGVDVNATDERRHDTALIHAAAVSGGSGFSCASAGYSHKSNPSRAQVAASVKALIAAGADVNLKGFGGVTALRVAVAMGDVDVVRLLLDAGAKTGEYDDLNGSNALLSAAEHGYPDIVRVLLSAGADKEATDHLDRYVQDDPLKLNFATPLIHASALGNADVVRVLLAAKVRIEATDYWGTTAFGAAIKNNHPDVAKLLRDAGAFPMMIKACAVIAGDEDNPVRINPVPSNTKVSDCAHTIGVEQKNTRRDYRAACITDTGTTWARGSNAAFPDPDKCGWWR